MQDTGLIEGGRVIDGGGEGGGERRLRPHNHQASLKCPRCDSSNTKFCYYNNYNLSQPRYFCKGCRRYWTKGGILRKVPVGGGCRKAKRSKTKPSAASTTVVYSPPHCKAELTNNNNNSSSGGTLEAVSAVTSHSTLYGNSNDLRFEHGSDGGIFSEIGSLTSLINSSKTETLSFDFGIMLNRPDQWQLQPQQGLFDETLRIEQHDLNCKLDSGFQPLDWDGIGDHQVLFDSSYGVDQTYWNQNQSTYQDQDHPPWMMPVITNKMVMTWVQRHVKNRKWSQVSSQDSPPHSHEPFN